MRVIALIWLTAALLCSYLRAAHARLEPPKPIVRYQDVLLDLMGEGRTVLARLLWFKMDMMHEQQDDLNVATFKQKEVVPLLRMINYLDPTLTDAYDTLAYELYKGYAQLDKAIELIEEGLVYSPGSYELNFRRAFFAERQNDWAMAFEHAQTAFNHAGEDDLKRLAALRCMYRSAVALDQPEIGLVVLDWMTRLSGRQNHPEQYRIWKKRLGRP